MVGLEAISILLLAVSIGCGLQAIRLLGKSKTSPQNVEGKPSPQACEQLIPVTVYIPQSLFCRFNAEKRPQGMAESKLHKRKRLVWRVGEHEACH